MKITKSELKEMIREALREELAKTKRPLKEAVPTTASAIINRYNNNVADHILELEHEKAFNDAEWYEDEWYVLENVKVDPDYFMLIMDRPVESDIDAEAIINYALGDIVSAKLHGYDYSESGINTDFDYACSEGGIVTDPESNEIYVERWVIA